MAARHLSLPVLLDQLSGRETKAATEHLSACAACRGQAKRARRLLDAGRAALVAPALSARTRRKALALFRREQRPQPGLLRCVLDSLLRPAPALRNMGTAARYLRFEGDVTVELQVTPQRRGVELRGQITPADFTEEIIVTSGKARRRASVKPDGTFVFRSLSRGKVDVQMGDGFIRDLEL
jgi:anti-sigma factor RsiW